MAAERRKEAEVEAQGRQEEKAGERAEWAGQPAEEHLWTQSDPRKSNRQEHYYRKSGDFDLF
jgi:hypothetical protein